VACEVLKTSKKELSCGSRCVPTGRTMTSNRPALLDRALLDDVRGTIGFGPLRAVRMRLTESFPHIPRQRHEFALEVRRTSDDLTASGEVLPRVVDQCAPGTAPDPSAAVRRVPGRCSSATYPSRSIRRTIASRSSCPEKYRASTSTRSFALRVAQQDVLAIEAELVVYIIEAIDEHWGLA
jgi:hypothetical protein